MFRGPRTLEAMSKPRPVVALSDDEGAESTMCGVVDLTDEEEPPPQKRARSTPCRLRLHLAGGDVFLGRRFEDSAVQHFVLSVC